MKDEVKEDVKITITDPYGKEINSLKGGKSAGIQKVIWNMRRKPTKEETERMRERGAGMRPAELVTPGEYVVILEAGEKKLTRKALIRKMPEDD